VGGGGVEDWEKKFPAVAQGRKKNHAWQAPMKKYHAWIVRQKENSCKS